MPGVENTRQKNGRPADARGASPFTVTTGKPFAVAPAAGMPFGQ